MKRLSLSVHYVSILIRTSLSLIQCFIPRFSFNGKNQPISLSKVADTFCRLLVLLEHLADY